MALNKISTEVISVKLEGAKEAEKELGGLKDGLEGVEDSTRGVDKATEEAGGGFSKLQAGVTTAGAAMAGFMAAAAAAGAAIKAIKAPVNLAIDFERQFAQVKTLNNQIGDDLKTELLALAAEVPQTAGDLTSATYQAISAGVAPTDVIEFMKAASQTAIAAGGSLTEAVELLTAGVNAFGKQGETAGSISNKLFATVKRGVTTIPELNSVFGRASAAASSYGVSVDEVLGAIAQMTLQGIPTNEAVTRINAVLKELSLESGKAARALKDKGVQLGVNALKQKGLVGVLEEVNKATRGQADATARLSTSQEAVQGLLKLTGDNMGAYASIVQGITDDTTAAGEATQVMADTTDGAQKLFESAKEGALRDLGLTVLPAVNELFVSMTREIGRSGSAVSSLGAVLRVGVKMLQFFVENLKPIAIGLASAFGVAYAPVFIAALGKMRAAIVAWNASLMPAGASGGMAYARGFMSSMTTIMTGPAAVGVIAALTTMLITSYNNAQREIIEKQRKQQREEAKTTTMEFLKDEKLNKQAIEESLKAENQRELLLKARVLTQKAVADGDRELAQGMRLLSADIDNNRGKQTKLEDLMLTNSEAAKVLARSLADTSTNAEDSAAAFMLKAQSSGSLAEKERILNEALKENKALHNESAEGASNAAQQVNLLAAAEEDAKGRIASLKAEYDRLNEESRGAFFFKNIAILVATFGEMPAELKPFYDEMVRINQVIEEGEKSSQNATIAQEDFQESMSLLRDDAVELTEELEKLAIAQGYASIVQDTYGKLISETTTALDDEIKMLKERAEWYKAEVLFDKEHVAIIEAGLKVEIKQARARHKQFEKDAKAAEQRRKRAIAGMNRVAAARFKNAQAAEKIRANAIISEEKLFLSELQHAKELEIAKLESDRKLDPVKKLQKRLKEEEMFAALILKQKLVVINEEEQQAQAAEERASKERRRKIKEAEKVASVRRGLLKEERKQTENNIAKIQQKADLEKRSAMDAKRQAEELADVRGPQDEAAAQQEIARQRSERAQFLAEMSDLDNLHAMAKFDAETDRLRREYKQQEWFLSSSLAEQAKINEAFDGARLRARKKHAKEIEEIERQQVLSAMSATENAIGEIGAVADALGASESFVGKIEAAQIIARGIMHGFEGASEQAEALSSFADGNIAGGVAHQAAAIAHFAQAGTAPIMARRAATRGGGGGAGAGGSVAASGPRTTARESRPERNERQAAVQFGDIILADVPALLSRNGSRQLGRQIAGDVARELNRRRALPGGGNI